MPRKEPVPLITSKGDLENARRLVELGYPTIAPVLPYILEWLQDYNWPVAHIVFPFLAQLGRPVIPEIRRVLATNDDVWKYWCIRLLSAMDPDVVEEIRAELTLIATEPTVGEQETEVFTEAKLLLARLDQRQDRED